MASGKCPGAIFLRRDKIARPLCSEQAFVGRVARFAVRPAHSIHLACFNAYRVSRPRFAHPGAAASTLVDEHGVAEGEQAVALINGMLVGAHDVVASGKGAYQHHER